MLETADEQNLIIAPPGKEDEMVPDPRFINVDLDLVHPDPMTNLAAFFGTQGVLLPREPQEGNHYLTFELAVEVATMERTLEAQLDLVEAMPAEAKKEWAGCTSRTFNVGMEIGASRSAAVVTLSESVTSRVAAVGGRFTFTHYPRHTPAD